MSNAVEEYLTKNQMQFESFTFDVSDEDEGRAQAEKLQLAVTTIYKTLVLKGNKTGMDATGYPHGANTPIGIFMQHKEYSQVFDTSILNHEEVIVSSGELGHSVKVKVADLIALIQPIQADILAV